MTDEETPERDEVENASPEGAQPAEEAAAEALSEPAAEDRAAEIAALNDKLLRALAETENLRRRSQRDREDTAKYAISNFARDMLSIADNLRRALDSVPPDLADDDAVTGLIEGVELTERELLAAFERHGISRIEAAGAKFDHERHEAMFEVPTADAPPGTVVEVLQTGYMIDDRLLRAARVGVAKAPPSEAADPHVDTKV